MIHPLLRIVATQPHLLVDHAEAYAGLVGEEVSRTVAVVKHRAVFLAGAAFLGLLAVIFGGVALMLWAASPDGRVGMPWLLVATPALPALLAVVCLMAGKSEHADAFATLKAQVNSDLALVRDMSAAS